MLFKAQKLFWKELNKYLYEDWKYSKGNIFHKKVLATPFLKLHWTTLIVLLDKNICNKIRIIFKKKQFPTKYNSN